MDFPRSLRNHLPDAADISAPRYVVDLPRIKRAQTLLADGDPVLGAASGRLLAEAEADLDAGPFTVTEKTVFPVSGDPHDYFSMGTYWWPDPDRPDGLPYLRRDGETNPETEQTDRAPLGALMRSVTTLCLAYSFSGREDFARRAALLLRVWFLDEAKRMNPHLEYGQAIPGICDGRGIGIIDTTGFAMQMLPAIAFLDGSGVWPAEERSGLQGWFRDYLEWLLTSQHGYDEATHGNNHSVAYDLQIANYALFIGAGEIARRVVEGVPARRVDLQIEPDGRQPRELARTKSLNYSTSNTSLFLRLIETGRCVGIDLADYENPDGRGIRRALDWLVPFYTGRSEWSHQQIAPFAPEGAYTLLRQAACIFDEPAYAEQAEEIEGLGEEMKRGARAQLLYPLGA